MSGPGFLPITEPSSELAGNSTPRSTPTSLGWTLDSTQSYLSQYQLVISKTDGPYLSLKYGQVTPDTPQIVHLAPSSGGYLTKDNKTPCMYPIPCYRSTGIISAFSRPADLVRHYLHVHNAKYPGSEFSQQQQYACDYSRCPRRIDPFRRKDHFRDHLADYHKEDIRQNKRRCLNQTEAEWERENARWRMERIVSPAWWRCAKCLGKIRVAKDGWVCPSCGLLCEPDRIELRQAATQV